VAVANADRGVQLANHSWKNMVIPVVKTKIFSIYQ